MSIVEEESFAAYVASMPTDYRSAFDVEATRAHEAVVRRRGSRSTHIEIWRQLEGRIVAICVVADDRPGLLSCITAALVAQRIDVVSAHAYCRTRGNGTVEAVDILWIRRVPGPRGSVSPIRAKDIDALRDAIDCTARGDLDVTMEPAVSERIKSAPPTFSVTPSAGSSARVRFETDEADGTTLLTVEAVDRPGLLLAVTQALFRAGLQIIALHATTEDGCAVDRFKLADADGGPLRREDLFALQIAILGAIEEGAFAPARMSAS
jgi:[protein-PII] uridylyltransferase